MNNNLIKQLNDSVIKYVKESDNKKIDDIYFRLLTDNYEIMNKYKEKILSLLDSLFESKDMVINLEELNKLDINENTYNIIFEYILANNIKYVDNLTTSNYNLMNSYLNDLNNYPMYPREKQQQMLYKNNKYVLLIKKYELKLLGQYYDIIEELSKKEEFSEIDSNRLKKYELKLINELYNNKKLFDLTEEQIYDFLYKRVKRYCVERKSVSSKYNSVVIDINEINIYNKRKLTKEEKLKIINKIKYLKEKQLIVKNDIAIHNLKLVISIARRYYKHNNTMTFEDLIQEGNFGLLNAIDKYDPTVGTTFATYATWWIQQAILRALYFKDRTVRLPIHFIEKLNKYKRFVEQYNKTYGYDPSDEEIVRELNLTQVEIYELNSHKTGVVSLNTPVNNEDDDELSLFVKDEKTNVEKEAINAQLNIALLNVLDGFDSYKQSVIYLRFGLIPKKPLVVTKNGKIIVFTLEPVNKEQLPIFLKNHNFQRELELYKQGDYEIKNVVISGDEKTLDEIGKMYGLTRERIRQVEEKTLRYLKNPRIKKQINFLDN